MFFFFFNLFISLLYLLDFIILFLLDNDVLETSKRRAMFRNILSQIFIIKYYFIAGETQPNVGLLWESKQTFFFDNSLLHPL